jgi:hypothetical protein
MGREEFEQKAAKEAKSFEMTYNTWRQWVPARSWLLLNTWFSLLVICLSGAAALHVPISRAAWPILIFCCGLVLVLVIRSRRAARAGVFPWRSILISFLMLGAVVTVL